MKTKMKLGLMLLIVSCVLDIGQAQVDSASDVGHATTQLGAYDSIDLSNLYLFLQIPVISKAGAPKLPFQYSIVGYPNVSPGVWGQTSTNLGIPYNPFGGIQFSAGPVICGTGSSQIYVANYTAFGFIDGTGTYYSFGTPLAGGSSQLACAGTSQSFRTADGSMSLTASVNSTYAMYYTVSDAQGTQIVSNAQGGGFLRTGWAANTNVGLSAFLYDSKGNVQISTACASNVCTSGSSAPTYNTTVGGTTTDGNLTWTNLGLPSSKLKDTNGNTVSVAITNLTGTTQSGGGSYADASRDYTTNQVWTYTDAMGLKPLTVTYPPLATSSGGLNPTAQIKMAYQDEAGTAENVYLNESYMAQTKPNAPTGLPLLTGPTVLGVNSTIDGAGVIHGNSFNNPSPYPYYPTSLAYPDGSSVGFVYEAVPGAPASGTATITSVGVQNDLATIDFSSLSTLTTASPITGIAVSGTPPLLTITFTVSGTNPWAKGMVGTVTYMSPVNLLWDGFTFTVSSVTTHTVVATVNYAALPIPNPETQGSLVAPIGALNFSGLTNALFLDNVTPPTVYFGTQPNQLGAAQAYTSSVAWYYYDNSATYNGYIPKAGDVVNISGFSRPEFNGTNITIASVTGVLFTVNGSYTQNDVSYGGAVLPVSLSGTNYLQFSFMHANYTQASDAGTIDNGGAPTTTTGRLAQITLSTGGTINYAYSGGQNNSGINTDGSYATLMRTTSDGTTTFTHTPATGSSSTIPSGALGQSFNVFTPAGLLIETGQVAGYNAYDVYPVVQANITNLAITGTTGNYTATATFTGGTTWIATGNLVYVYAPSSEFPISYVDFSITGVSGSTFTFFCGEECNGTFNGAVAGYATTGAVYSQYRTTGGPVPGILSYSNSTTSVASTTTVTDPAGNETMYAFAGLRQVDEKIFQGTPKNALLNSGFESGASLADWLINGVSTTPWTGTITSGAGSVTYTDIGSNLDAWGTGNAGMNAANGELAIGLGVSNAEECCAGGYPQSGPVTQTVTITSISISGSTVTASITGSLPSNYATGKSAVIALPGTLSVLNGTFNITATNPNSSPQTFSWAQTAGYSCSTSTSSITNISVANGSYTVYLSQTFNTIASGGSGSWNSSGTFTSTTNVFTNSMVGDWILVGGAPSFVITAYISPTQVSFTPNGSSGSGFPFTVGVPLPVPLAVGEPVTISGLSGQYAHLFVQGTWAVASVNSTYGYFTFNTANGTTIGKEPVSGTATGNPCQMYMIGEGTWNGSYLAATTNVFNTSMVGETITTGTEGSGPILQYLSASEVTVNFNFGFTGPFWMTSPTGLASVTVTPPPNNVTSVQVAQVNGQWTMLVTVTSPPAGFRLGAGGTALTFSGTAETWLNGLSLVPLTWNGQTVFGFTAPSGAPQPYGPSTEPTTAVASCAPATLPTVYTSDWVHLTNINIPSSEVPVGSALTGVTFSLPFIYYTDNNPTTLSAQLVSNGALVGTAKTCTVAGSATCTFGNSTDTWGTSGLTWGPNIGIALQATIQNPNFGNAQVISICCEFGANYSITVNSNTTAVGWTATQVQAQSGSWSATSASATDTQLLALNSSGSQYMAVNPNDQIQYGGYLLRTTGTGKMWWTCAFYDSTKTFISQCPNLGPITQQTTLPPGVSGTLTGPFAPANWTYYTGIAFAPSNAAYVTFYAEVHGQGDTDTSVTTIYADNASFLDLTSSGLLKEVVTCYNQPFLGGSGNNTNVCANPAAFIPLNASVTEADVYTFVPGVTTRYAGGGPSVVAQTYDSYGRLSNVALYDYGQTTISANRAFTSGTYTGALTTSASASNCSPLANAAITIPVCMSVLRDSAGTIWDEAVYQYDANGNKTAMNNIDVLDSKNVVYNYEYTTKGELTGASDPNGNQFTADWTLCNDLAVSKLFDSLLSMSYGVNCASDLVTSITDANGNMWTNTYSDPVDRITSQTTPLTSSSYTDSTVYAYTPNSISTTVTFNSGNSVDGKLSTLDRLGRVVLTQRPYSTSQYTTTQETYNSVGLLSNVSLPFLSPANTLGTNPASNLTMTYDSAHRPLTATNANGGVTKYQYIGRDTLITTGGEVTQLETNAFGEVLSSCQVTSLVGSGSCGQDNFKTGYLTTYSYNPRAQVTHVSRNGQPSSAAPQFTVVTFDGFGRQLTVTRPESGTTTYTWDSDSSGTCSTSLGDVVRIGDANGNVTCNSFDLEHRLLSKTYPSGPNAAATPAKYFVYDSSSAFTCPNGANAKGRLAEVYTGSSTSKTTDEGFCYSARGDLTDEFETTPNSGGYFHTIATYWPDWSIETLSGVPGIAGSFTYTPGYAWVNTVKGPSSASLVTSTTSVFGTIPSVITYGSGDADTFSLDSHQNFSGFSSTVGTSTVSNTWGWNANNTPTTQLISNPFDLVSSGLTCSYGWDGLVRITSYKCVNTSTSAPVWGQAYSYDMFGNVKKAIPSGYAGQKWSPTYNLANNQYTGSPFAYDTDGQITNDSFNTYTWGSDGKVMSVTNIASGVNTTYTYDALGRLVEEATSNVSGHTQFVQSPIGKIATTTSTK